MGFPGGFPGKGFILHRLISNQFSFHRSVINRFPNLTFCFSKLHCLPPSKLSSPIPSSPQVRTQYKITDDSPISFVESMSKVCITALVSASLFFVADPSLAFKGGGSYGSEVTRGQDLTGKDFSGRTLIKQDFKTSILRQANFKGAKLLGASFFDSDLTGDDLSDANLRGAGFSLANITKANLTNANLEGALVTGNTSFKGSIITCTDFTDVPLREDQKEYLCRIADGVNSITDNETRETLFCE